VRAAPASSACTALPQLCAYSGSLRPHMVAAAYWCGAGRLCGHSVPCPAAAGLQRLLRQRTIVRVMCAIMVLLLRHMLLRQWGADALRSDTQLPPRCRAAPGVAPVVATTAMAAGHCDVTCAARSPVPPLAPSWALVSLACPSGRCASAAGLPARGPCWDPPGGFLGRLASRAVTRAVCDRC
jgi:hypothetical protein